MAAEDTVAADLSQMLMVGFDGTSAGSASARRLAGHIAKGRVGSVFFVKANVGSRNDVAGLVAAFRQGAELLVGIDHEGGAVQRLVEKHGFAKLPRARTVASEMSAADARRLYAGAGADVAALGFNVNFAPVVDLHDADNPAIGHYGRSFSDDPEVIAAYATAFVDGFTGAGVGCTLKHFPGSGRSHDDSHVDLPDVSATWRPDELRPYQVLMANGRAPMVMVAHLRLDAVEPDPIPVSLSRSTVTGLLRNELGFTGIAITDDLDMAAITATSDRRRAVIRAIAAGNDLLMVRNVTREDPDFPANAIDWVRDAIADGTITPQQLRRSADRVRTYKRSLIG